MKTSPARGQPPTGSPATVHSQPRHQVGLGTCWYYNPSTQKPNLESVIEVTFNSAYSHWRLGPLPTPAAWFWCRCRCRWEVRREDRQRGP